MRKHLKQLKILESLAIYIIYNLIITLLSYFYIIPYSKTYLIIFVMNNIIIFLIGIRNGKRLNNKAYLKGLLFGLLITSFIILINLLFIREFTIKTLIYYLVIIASSIISHIFGINLKRN